MLTTEKECIDYIHSLGKFGKKSGLDNITALCTALGNPEKKIRAIGGGVVYLLLAIFGLNIVSAAIMQSDFNSL